MAQDEQNSADSVPPMGGRTPGSEEESLMGLPGGVRGFRIRVDLLKMLAHQLEEERAKETAPNVLPSRRPGEE